MIYPWFDYCQRQATTLAGFMKWPFAEAEPWARYLRLGPEFFARNAASAEPVAVDLKTALADPNLEHRIVESDPFAAISMYRRPSAPNRTILAVLPHSGYAASALRAFVDALLNLGTVVVTEWRDPRLVPMSFAGFGLLDQVALLERTLEKLNQPVTVIGLSQAGWPTVIAAERHPKQVQAIAMLGAPIDPTSNPSPMQDWLAATPLTMVEQMLTSTVPDRFAGRGRRVFPALLQLWTHAGTSPMQYFDAQNGLINSILNNKPAIKHDEMHRLCDVPAELFLDMIGLLRRSPQAILDDFAGGFDVEALQAKPLLTVEADADPLVGRGQTHGVGHLLRSKTHAQRTIKGGDHIDLFVGPQFTNQVLTGLAEFVVQHSPET